MNLRVDGCNFRTAPLELRETLALDATAALELATRCGGEAAILSTCNRVELYTASASGTTPDAAAFLAERCGTDAAAIRPLLYHHADADAVRHLFRVTAGLDSLVLGESQIARQVKDAYESAQNLGTSGPLLHALFSHSLRTGKRVRSETGLAAGHASIASIAVEYVEQVFDHFGDKTVLVIGTGKIGRLTLRHLRALHPARILVANRRAETADAVARECDGRAVPWSDLDSALADADIVLSATGAAEPIVSREHFDRRVRPRRRGALVVLDLAVPRDFDAAIHDGDRVCVFNIDDLQRVREASLTERRRHVAPAEAIIEAETGKFLDAWQRRQHAPVIRQLRDEMDKLRGEVLGPLLDRMNGRLTDDEKARIAGAFRLFQNRLLHGPLAALQDASRDGQSSHLLESLKKLFRLGG